MSLIAKETGSGGAGPIPASTYTAVCYGMVDLGTHHSDRFDKDTHKVLIMWEIPDERIDIERDGQKASMPRVISQRYTMSLHEKATLRHILEAWRGRAFKQEELDGFDLKKIVGAGCMLGIVHEERNGKTYAGISSVLALPKNVKAPAPENEVCIFEIEDDAEPGFPVPEELYPWVQDIIKKSQEWTGEGGADRPSSEGVDLESNAPLGEDDSLPF